MFIVKSQTGDVVEYLYKGKVELVFGHVYSFAHGNIDERFELARFETEEEAKEVIDTLWLTNHETITIIEE